ncbi:MAG TPA: FtsX-like permease family protein [Verrucomicrobiae bacterium]|nr:FtsX-like permease family protein [Verrucomicrobiae bacterium]
MTFRTLIRRSLRFHWRSHLGVVLGAAIGSAALIGALVVGDSVRGSLREQALQRLGEIGYAMETLDRSVTDELATRMKQPVRSGPGTGGWDSGWDISPSTFARFGLPQPLQALVLSSTATRADGKARANQVQLIGAPSGGSVKTGDNSDDWFFHYFGFGIESHISERSIWVNASLAEKLDLRVGDEVLFRIQKGEALSGEVAISSRDSQLNSLRLRVEKILSSSARRGSPPSLADFDLKGGSQTSLNAFVNRSELQDAAEMNGRVNLLLQTPLYESSREVHHSIENLRNNQKLPAWIRNLLDKFVATREAAPTVALSKLSEMLQAQMRLADLESDLRTSQLAGTIDLVSHRVFLDDPIVRSASAEVPNAQPLLTYLATLLCAGTNATPYSMVTAAGAPWTPTDLKDDEIVISQWLADDLHVKSGDELAMSYFLPESGAKLEEATNTFRVHSIVPKEMPWADRTLMPDFPGIEKAESTSEWDAGFPLTYKVRPKDDEYWRQHRGTPKAFVTLAAGQKMWGNRFGNLTAIRFPIPTNAVGTSSTSSQTSSKTNGDAVERVPTSVAEYRAILEKKILANLKPEELGLRFEPVREQALKAAKESQDFGGLFLGFSFFLIIAALLLMTLLFQLGLEQRAPEIGTFLALGFTPKQVRNLLLREGVALAFVGGILGTMGGLWYAKAMLHGLTTIWRDAVGASTLSFHFTGQTLAIGLCASVIVSVVTIWLSLRKFVKRPARELLVGDIGNEEIKARGLKSTVFGAVALLSGLSLVGFAVAKGDTTNAGIFFGAGALVLVAGLSFGSGWLTRLGGAPNSSSVRPMPHLKRADQEIGAPVTLFSLALRGGARRRKRSLSTVAMLACGSFLIVSIGVFRLDANRDATKKTSGTGGFAFIGETTMPVVQDLNSESGREFFALNAQDLNGVSFVPFRVREGDEASCLNLNAAQRPRLVGVRPELLDGRFSFAKGEGWLALKSEIGNQKSEIEIPAIGDANSIQWAMKKKVGDTIDYVDERGQPFKVRIVGAVANSILQGQLIIDEAEFVKRFPGESGYRTFLIDAPSNTLSRVSATLSRAMEDVGLELTPAAQRLAQFNAVQNTYLGTFQVLGGLGLLLGSVGLGIVVLRNVLERRGELALLMAVGFRKPQVQQLLLMENGALLVAGLALGVIAATVAVLPALLSPGAQLPMVSLALTLSAVLINGACWTWAATRLALRGDLLVALRNE